VPPPVRPADAPADSFSAERASHLLAEITRHPHPVGSTEHRRVRETIEREIAALGLAPETHRTFVAERRRGRIDAMPVTNLLARLPGDRPTGTLLLLAHYDAVPGSPGAGDDAAGVAALLETMRALVAERRNGPPLAEDVLFLITDAEELGLHGARAFTAEHPAMDDVRMVLNVEARGAAGVSILFETGPTDARLLHRAAAALDRPYGNSFSADVYRFMPNDTDFSPFRDLGLPGFNFAFIGDYPAYHATVDSAERLDPRSVQHHGDQLLALTRAFAGDGFGQLPAATDPATPPGAAFLTLPFAGLLAYPTAWTIPLALLALALFAAVAYLGRHLLRPGRFAAALAVVLGALVVPMVAVWLLSKALYAVFGLGVESLPPSPVPELAWTAVALTLATACLLASARRLGPLALGLAGAVPWLVLAVVAAFALPSSQQLFVWPLLFLLAGLLPLARRTDEDAPPSVWALGLLLAAVVVTLWTWVPLLPLLALAFPPMAPLLVAFGTVITVVLLAAPLVLFAGGGERWWPTPAVVGAVAVVALVAVVVTGGYSPERPKPDGLFYALDADSGGALWASFDAELDDWTAAYLTGGERRSLEGFFQGGPQALAAPAPRLPLAAPVVTLLEEEQIDKGGEAMRSLRLAASSPRGAEQTWVRLTAPGLEVRAVNGTAIETEGPTDVEWIRLFADSTDPEAAVEIEVQVPAGESVTVAAIDRNYGLPALPGEGSPQRPEGYRPARFTVTDLSMVRKEWTFAPPDPDGRDGEAAVTPPGV
ncbi:MAG TPA: M20/M25/M40 family metallo-hydrolase, partial [Thermoanaerobaculia bacterium]|nr:M20/M25/M40 family metallo-hydrolase [Thermoanaerobaculia bacterium]